MPKITVFIKDGKAELDMDGYPGEACVNDLVKLHEAIKKEGVNLQADKVDAKEGSEQRTGIRT